MGTAPTCTTLDGLHLVPIGSQWQTEAGAIWQVIRHRGQYVTVHRVRNGRVTSDDFTWHLSSLTQTTARRIDGGPILPPARGPVRLSNGRTVLHRRELNGSQFAYIEGDETNEMTPAEWSEYCDVIAGKAVTK